MKDDDITIWDCPRCDGRLIKRKNRENKRFLGCTNYPKCKYTQPVEDENDDTRPDGLADAASVWE